MFLHPFRPTKPGRSRPRSYRRSGQLVLLTGTLALCSPPATSAQAATTGCPSPPTSEAFAQWGDTNSYQLVSQGDFEGSLSQWTLSGGASAVAGSEPYGATGVVGRSSLALPAGASAQSPFTCVTENDPTFRFFARNDGPLSKLAITIVYRTALGTAAIPLGAVTPSATWQPTPPLPTGSAIAALLSAGTAQLALRFTAPTGPAQIDDVFIDPRMR